MVHREQAILIEVGHILRKGHSYRQAVLLVAGDKSGGSQERFYRELIRKVDQRFDAHLERIKNKRT